MVTVQLNIYSIWSQASFLIWEEERPKEIPADEQSTPFSTTTEDPVAVAEFNTLQTIAVVAYTHILSAIIVVGVVGNILNLLVLTQRNMKRAAYSYLRALAVSDMIALLLVITYAADMYAIQPKATLAEAVYGAHIEFPLKQTFNASSTLIVMALTVERFVAMCYPHRSKSWCTQRRTTVIVLLLMLYAFLWNIPRIFERKIDQVYMASFNKTMYYDKNLSEFGKSDYYRVHTILYATMFQFVPLVVLASLNICIIVALHRFHQNRKVLLNKRESRERGEQARMTLMLIGIIVMFLVLVVPGAIAYIINAYDNFSVKVFIVVSDVMGEANFAMNFFVYCLCSREFRNTFTSFFFCFCRRSNKVKDDSNTFVTTDKVNSTSKDKNDSEVAVTMEKKISFVSSPE